MDEPGVETADRSLATVRTIAWLLLGLSVIVLVIAVLLPNYALEWLREEYWIFGYSLNWLDMNSPGIDLTHVILFAWIGLQVSCLWPRAPWWRIAMPLLGLAVASELLQFLVPGRSPLIGDLYDDLLGVALGVTLAQPVKWWMRRKVA